MNKVKTNAFMRRFFMKKEEKMVKSYAKNDKSNEKSLSISSKTMKIVQIEQKISKIF